MRRLHFHLATSREGSGDEKSKQDKNASEESEDNPWKLLKPWRSWHTTPMRAKQAKVSNMLCSTDNIVDGPSGEGEEEGRDEQRGRFKEGRQGGRTKEK